VTYSFGVCECWSAAYHPSQKTTTSNFVMDT